MLQLGFSTPIAVTNAMGVAQALKLSLLAANEGFLDERSRACGKLLLAEWNL